MKKAVVRKQVILCYGGTEKAWISLRTGQKWDVSLRSVLDKDPAGYVLSKNGITIDVSHNYFDKYFRWE